MSHAHSALYVSCWEMVINERWLKMTEADSPRWNMLCKTPLHESNRRTQNSIAPLRSVRWDTTRAIQAASPQRIA
jgi:hypothetical protein